MKKYILSNKAVKDLVGISQYSRTEFGEAQVKAYLTGLKEILFQLSDNPLLGQNVADIRPHYVATCSKGIQSTFTKSIPESG